MPSAGAARFMKRALAAVFVVSVVAVALGFVNQRRADARALAEHPAPGAFLYADGHRLHYRSVGAGDVTFVLESGLGDYSASWGGLEHRLAALGRVIVYDRAGYGWSEPGMAPRTIQQLTRELHALLSGLDLRGPVVLVGHSMGGAIVTLYAVQHPERVAGLLLIDPSHRDQVAQLPAPPFLEEFLGRHGPRTARIGLAGVLFGSADPIRNRATHIATFGAELRAVDRSVELWGEEPIDLGAMPVYVLTAGSHDAWPGETAAERAATWEIWRRLHAGLVSSSSSDTRRHIIVEGARHYIHEDNPAVVVHAARELVGRIHGNGAPWVVEE